MEISINRLKCAIWNAVQSDAEDIVFPLCKALGL